MVRMGKGSTKTVLVREPKDRIHLQEIGANGKIILKLILKECHEWPGLDSWSSG